MASVVRKIGSLAIANWPIKLMAFVLAVVLWAVVTAQEITTQLVDVALDVSAPEGRTIIGELPHVQARYRGTQRELLKLLPSPPVIRKQVPATTGNTRSITLSTEDLLGVDDADVAALEVLPGSIVVVMDSILRKLVPVQARVEIRADSGYEVFGNVRISPNRVTLQGPAALVTPIRDVTTRVLRRTGLTGPVDFALQIDTAGLGAVTVLPQSVNVTADIGAVSTRVLLGVSVSVEGGGGGWSSSTTAVSVTVRGPTARVRSFTRDSVRVVARPSGSDEAASETVLLQVIPPDGVTGVATPDSVLIRRSSGG